MHLTTFQWYVIAINVIAFLVFTIDYLIYTGGGDGIKPEVLCNLVTICGGAMGALIAELLWDRKFTKKNAQSRIYSIVWLIVQIAFFLAIWGPNRNVVKERALDFFEEHKILCIYYAAINVITFFVFAIDKIKAILGKYRIRELFLFGLCILGGGIGGLLSMDLFNHKVSKMHFMFGVPATICAHFVLFGFIALGAI